MKKSLKAAIISLGSTSSKWTYEAMQNYFEEVEYINIKEIEINLGPKDTEILYLGQPLKDYDCIYAKGSFRYADVLNAIKSKLDKKTYMPISASAFSIGHDKVLSQIVLQKHKVPMPITYLSPSVEAAKQILKKINYPIIMKIPKGTQGKGVMVADSYPSASSMLDTLASLRQPFLIQEYIETDGEDLRLIVTGDKVVAAMKRVASGDEKRANIHAGGKGIAYLPSEHVSKVAVQAAKVIGAEICAVDILESIKGPLVLEINLSPGLQGITKATDIDVADKIAKFLHKRTLELKNKDTEKGSKKILDDLGINDYETPISREIITNLDLRNNKILLPELITKLSKFKETDEVIVKVEKGEISIKKMI